MKVVGTGVDIVDMTRIERLLSEYGERFLGKILTEKEREMVVCKTNPKRILECVASLFSIKESVFKAIGGKKINFNEIEILRQEDGFSVILYGRTKQISEKKNIDKILVSVSHDSHLCITSALAVSNVLQLKKSYRLQKFLRHIIKYRCKFTNFPDKGGKLI